MPCSKAYLLLLLTSCLVGINNAQQCNKEGLCEGDLLATFNRILSASQCLVLCQNSEKCGWYSYQSNSKSCFHFEDCASFLDGTSLYVSGESSCALGKPEAPFFFGSNTFTVIDLINPEVEYDCGIPEYPIHLGSSGLVTLMHASSGDPIILYCGGGIETLYFWDCYEFKGHDWVQSGITLPETIVHGGNLGKLISVEEDESTLWYVENVYDQDSYVLDKATNTWTEGPSEIVNIWASCITSLNATHTLTTGGESSKAFLKDTYTFDWKTLKVTELAPLKDARFGHHCAANGLGDAWVIGGNETPITQNISLERYDPAADSWITVSEEQLSEFMRRQSADFVLIGNTPCYVDYHTAKYFIWSQADNGWLANDFRLMEADYDWGYVGLVLPTDMEFLGQCTVKAK